MKTATIPAPLADSPFRDIAGLIREHAQHQPSHDALIEGERRLDYRGLDALMDRVAAALQRDGLQPGDAIGVCAAPSLEYAALFLGALRAGVAVAPLAPGSAPDAFARMLDDAGARLLFLDSAGLPTAGAAGAGRVSRIALDGGSAGRRWADWLAPQGAQPARVEIRPEWAFNIIYSSGTTGEPKGIVQPHAMRWAHVRRGARYGYGPGTVSLFATPLYSNTTLVVFFPTLAFGGTAVLCPKFDARGYLELAQRHRATHTMLVPVQYQRLMALPEFDTFDLDAFRFKFCTSAPFSAALKAQVLRRWPGGLVEFYGMTEGGGTCILEAHLHPDKLHTVGRPAEGHDIRLIDDAGRELPAGAAGEVVGRSPGMMTGYHRKPEATRAAEWFSPEGLRFIRTGDIGRFDAQGFLTLLDRKKDMIISGGFNLYPSDLEAVLCAHPAVAEAAVVGVPSAAWGETPVAFVVLRPGSTVSREALLQAFNAQVGKTQRLADLRLVDELPRSPIGKVLKRTLREAYVQPEGGAR
ncbi:MAG: class I adenylate-forming enzyme family protein [Pseudomonadota bacterium]